MFQTARSTASRRCVSLFVDELESRLSPSTTPVAGSLTPAQVRHAYGFDRVNFGTVTGDGSGQTIAIVVAGSTSSVRGDLQTFDRQFGLADPPSLTIAAPYGTSTATPTWALETALDVEWAHAAAPGANLLLVQATTGGLADLIAAANFARQQAGVSVVSMSWGSAEFAAETYFDGTFTTPTGKGGVTFVASTGDTGAANTLWPAVSTNVIAVGGTQLTTDAAGNVLGETAWSSGGGGLSTYETAPAGQTALTGSAQRGAPDVSFDAVNLAVYCSTAVNGWTGWMTAGGTSAGVPQWAGLIAVANQGRALAGKAPLNNTPAAIYSLSANDFRDITAGSNGHNAAPGYDLATGRGSPLADRVVGELVGPAPTPPVVPAPVPAPSHPSVSQPTTKAPTTGKTTGAPPAPAPKVNLALITNLVINFLLKTTGKSLQQTPAPAPTTAAVILPSAGANFLGTGIVAGPLAK